MCDYKEMYLRLFNGITDEIHVLENEIEKLKFLQLTAEEMYNAQMKKLRTTTNKNPTSEITTGTYTEVYIYLSGETFLKKGYPPNPFPKTSDALWHWAACCPVP